MRMSQRHANEARPQRGAERWCRPRVRPALRKARRCAREISKGPKPEPRGSRAPRCRQGRRRPSGGVLSSNCSCNKCPTPVLSGAGPMSPECKQERETSIHSSTIVRARSHFLLSESAMARASSGDENISSIFGLEISARITGCWTTFVPIII